MKKIVKVKGDTKKTFNPTPIKKQRRISKDSVADEQDVDYALSSADIKKILKLQ